MIVPYHPSWDIKDSSKLDDWITCRRMYFYRHILGWRVDAPAHDLFFGECWHAAREYGLLNGYEDIEGAYKVFVEKYRTQFSEHTDEIYTPKVPEAVLKGLLTLAVDCSRDLIENEIVELNGKPLVEISGTVPISNSRTLYYRIDSIMRNKESGKIFSWDHKTTSAKYIKSNTWANQFYLSIQNGTYTHCLYCMFDIEEVLGVEFYGVGFEYLTRNSSTRQAGYYATFKKVPAFKTPDQMNTWLWNVNRLCEEIDYEMECLDKCSANDDVMQAFPMNPKSCISYRGCSYHDFCLAWQNPLRYIDEPPIGFHVDFWNPAEKASKNVIDLEIPYGIS